MTGFITHGFDSTYPATDWVDPADGIGRWRVRIKGTVGNAATGHTTRGDAGIFTGNS